MALRVKNIAMGFYKGGKFYPIRASEDYDPERVGESKHYASSSARKAAIARGRKYMEENLGRKPPSRRKKATKKAAKKTASKPRQRKGVLYDRYGRPTTLKGIDASVSLGKVKVPAAKGKRKKNPLPLNRYVSAKIKRTRSGDLKVMIPLR